MSLTRTYSVDTQLTPGKVCQLLTNGKVNDLPIAPFCTNGTTQSYDFFTSLTDYAITPIDASTAWIIYKNDTNVTYVDFLTVSPTSVTKKGPTTLVSTNSYGYYSTTPLQSTRMACVYNYTGNYYCAVETISGTTITKLNSEILLGSCTSLGWSQVVTLDPTHLFVAFRNANGFIETTVLTATITSDTVTLAKGTNVVINGVDSRMGCATLLDSTHVHIAYRNNITGYLENIVVSISGSIITAGGIVAASNVNSANISTLKVDSTHIFNIYQNNTIGSIDYVYSTISGITVTPNAPSMLTTGLSTGYLSANWIDSNTALLGFGNKSLIRAEIMLIELVNTNKLARVTGDVNYTFTSGSFYLGELVMFSPTLFITAVVASANSYLYHCPFTINTKIGSPLGIVQDLQGTVVIKGLSSIHSNLAPGLTYYYDKNGNISTDSSGTALGTALTPTTLNVDHYIPF